MGLITLRYDAVLGDACAAAREMNFFAGGSLSEDRMAAAVEQTLHRQRK